ncbi:hypothetical protein BGZ46_006858 [Entomortierella lignicola]|nr:hypothetical protein BGZ46_006858 [Entomortierella lignicola]
MKWDHDSESVVASGDGEDLTMTDSFDPKQSTYKNMSLLDAQNEPETQGSPYAKEIEMIEDEVSHMVVEVEESRGKTLCSSVPDNANDANDADTASSPCSSASSHDGPLTPTTPVSSLFSTALGGGVHKSSDTNNAPGLSRSSDNRSYNRTSPWSFSSTSSSSSSYSSYSSAPTSSLIRSDESVYAAVPISHELYIIPKSSRGFHWNGDLFLKPHQRRSLGVDHMFNMADQQQYQLHNDSGNDIDSGSHGNGLQQNQHRHNQDSSVLLVHEIHLDDHEIAGILPSWP